jgi:hypothetical protein
LIELGEELCYTKHAKHKATRIGLAGKINSLGIPLDKAHICHLKKT